MTSQTASDIQQVIEELTGSNVRIVTDPTLDPLVQRQRLAPAKARAESLPLDGLPKTLNELTAATNRSYDVTLTRAGELSIPVVGTVGGGTNRRVVVLERIAYKQLQGADEIQHHYGYALRLCVTVNKWDAKTQISLPFLAASAQLGQTQASWTLQVLGLAGPQIDAAAIPPTELNVETFVLAKQSLTALIQAVNDPSTNFVPHLIASVTPLDQRHRELRIAAAQTFALSRLARRSPLPDALRRLSSEDPVLNSAIQDVYDVIGASDSEKPTEAASAKSWELLGSIEADV